MKRSRTLKYTKNEIGELENEIGESLSKMLCSNLRICPNFIKNKPFLLSY